MVFLSRPNIIFPTSITAVRADDHMACDGLTSICQHMGLGLLQLKPAAYSSHSFLNFLKVHNFKNLELQTQEYHYLPFFPFPLNLPFFITK